ncbi:hypothetical protein AB0D12_31920 [Streptomyces sp. NPDC048479]|uniref:hypothetical protein n=1 Tax=Streptomyces sp. NPDC048479 TaxID=3154725 RepID=UPI003445D1B8
MARYTLRQPVPDSCAHQFVAAINPSVPVIVRLCSLCREIDWDDLAEQVDREYRKGWADGRAGVVPTER